MKSKMRGFFSSVALVLMLILVLTGCSQLPQDTVATSEAEVSPTTDSGATGTTTDNAEKILTIGMPYTINTLEPWKLLSDGDRYITSNIYESLVLDNLSGNHSTGLAKSWEIVDGTKYIFTLRDNAYWQTGNDLFGDEKVQVTANDVKAVYEWIMDQANGSTEATDLSSKIESIEVVDNFTLVIYAKEPNALLLKEASDIQIFPMKAIETGYDLNAHPVGSGAYKFVEYKPDDKVVLERNDDFYIHPNLDRVEIKIIPDSSVGAVALANGEIDILAEVLSTDLEMLGSKDNIEILPNPLGWYRYLAFNASTPLFQDILVRQAISELIDFEAISEALFSNNLGLTIGFNTYGGSIPLELEGADYDAWKSTYSADPEKGAALLAQAGWEKNAQGIYEKDGTPLSFTIKHLSGSNNFAKFADMIAIYLKSAGVDVTLVPLDWATLVADIHDGNTEAFIMGGGACLGGLNMMFNTDTMTGYCCYNDPVLNDMLKKAYQITDDAARNEALQEAGMHIYNLKLHAGGYFEYMQVGMNKRVQDFVNDPELWRSLCCDARNVGVSD